MKAGKMRGWLLAAILLAPVFPANASEQGTDQGAQQWQEAETTPYGRYPETVHYTLGKMTDVEMSGLPEGDSYDDNAYTRYLKNLLNVESEITFRVDGSKYGEQERVLVMSGNIPDVMVVSSAELLGDMMEYGMLEDLTPYYETCLSPRIREIYDSYGSDRFDSVASGGKIYALPELDVYSGAQFIWLRKDWMDALGLEEPQTLQDVEDIIRAFLQQDPGGNGEGRTVGLLCDSELMADTSRNYSLAPVFRAFGAYPGTWIPKEDGSVVYGTV